MGQQESTLVAKYESDFEKNPSLFLDEFLRTHKEYYISCFLRTIQELHAKISITTVLEKFRPNGGVPKFISHLMKLVHQGSINIQVAAFQILVFCSYFDDLAASLILYHKGIELCNQKAVELLQNKNNLPLLLLQNILSCSNSNPLEDTQKLLLLEMQDKLIHFEEDENTIICHTLGVLSMHIRLSPPTIDFLRKFIDGKVNIQGDSDFMEGEYSLRAKEVNYAWKTNAEETLQLLGLYFIASYRLENGDEWTVNKSKMMDIIKRYNVSPNENYKCIAVAAHRKLVQLNPDFDAGENFIEQMYGIPLENAYTVLYEKLRDHGFKECVILELFDRARKTKLELLNPANSLDFNYLVDFALIISNQIENQIALILPTEEHEEEERRQRAEDRKRRSEQDLNELRKRVCVSFNIQPLRYKITTSTGSCIHSISFFKRVESFRSTYSRQIGQLLADYYSSRITVIKLNREHVVRSLWDTIFYVDQSDLCKLIFQFEGEEGIDAGGLTKEMALFFCDELNHWKTILIDGRGKIPGWDLKRTLVSFNNDMRGFPTPNADPMFYLLLGRIVGICLYSGINIDLELHPLLFEAVLGNSPFTYEHLESRYEGFERNLARVILETEDVEQLYLDYSYRIDDVSFLLKENGEAIDVTSENRLEYLTLYANSILGAQCVSCLEAFANAVREVIPLKGLAQFSASELRDLLFGCAINVSDLRAHTIYSQSQAGNTESVPVHVANEFNVVQWFWQIMESETNERLEEIMTFITARSRSPSRGFIDLDPKFMIIIDLDATPQHYPSSSTCGNWIKLPRYTSLEEFREKLTEAIKNRTFENK